MIPQFIEADYENLSCFGGGFSASSCHVRPHADSPQAVRHHTEISGAPGVDRGGRGSLWGSVQRDVAYAQRCGGGVA